MEQGVRFDDVELPVQQPQGAHLDFGSMLHPKPEFNGRVECASPSFS
jgi:hypothetical protein